MIEDSRLAEARNLYEDAVFGGDTSAAESAHQQLDSLDADLALSRGRILHAEFLQHRQEDPLELAAFERAVELYQSLGDSRGEGEALFWLGTFHQVVRGDSETALPALRRAYELSLEAGDKLTVSYAVRHLGFADLAAGRIAEAHAWLEESVKLRRELGFLPGVAAGVLALADVAWADGRRDDAYALLDEAAAIATGCGAKGTLNWIEHTRAEWLASS